MATLIKSVKKMIDTQMRQRANALAAKYEYMDWFDVLDSANNSYLPKAEVNEAKKLMRVMADAYGAYYGFQKAPGDMHEFLGRVDTLILEKERSYGLSGR